MSTTTNVAQVKLNIMTKQQYDAATKVATELYAVTDGGAVDEIIEFQQPTSANSYTWYRKYKSGWVEQGGRAAGPVANSNTFTISLPVEMANAGYTVTFCGTTRSTVLTADARYTTYFQFFYSNNLQNVNGYDFSWEVRGMAA